MKDYVEQLGLDFDPFEPGRISDDFFSGGNRQAVLEEVLEQVLYSDRMVAIYGPPGSGKSTLGRALVRQLGKAAVCLQLTPTLSMNSPQFFSSLCEQLPDLGTIHDPATTLDRLSASEDQLDPGARFLLVVIDDAHELKLDIFAELDALQSRCPRGSLHVVMQGEAQLLQLLESVFGEGSDRVASFELAPLSSEASIEYLKFKLAQAGYIESLPQSVVLGGLHNSASGLPAKLNALASKALSNAVAEPAQADEDGRLEPDVGSLRPNSAADWDSPDPLRPDLTPAAAPSERLPLWQQHWRSVAVLVIALVGVGVLSLSDGDQAAGGAANTTRLDKSQVGNQLRIPVITQPEAAAASAAVTPAAPTTIAAPNTASANTPTVSSSQAAVTAVDKPADRPSANTVMSSPGMPAAATDAATAPSGRSRNGPQPDIAVTARPAPAIPIQSSQRSSYEQQLLALPAGYYTVQLLGSRSEENVRRFIRQSSLGDARYFETSLEGKPWFVVVLGSYPALSDAAAVLESLPQDLQSLKPWIRSIGGIQADLNEAADG